MALAIKIGDTYDTGLLVNAPVVDIDITDYIGTFVLISSEHETDVEVKEDDERTFKLHKIQIDRDLADELFTDFDSIPTFSTYPDWSPSLAICKEWDGLVAAPWQSPDYYIPSFATKLYAGTNGIDNNTETSWFDPSSSPLVPPISYENETEYEEDWSNFETEDWKWKYCKLNFQ